MFNDGPYPPTHTSLFNLDIFSPGVVGDSFLDIEPVPQLHVPPHPQAIQPIKFHPYCPHPKQPLAATKASP